MVKLVKSFKTIYMNCYSLQVSRGYNAGQPEPPQYSQTSGMGPRGGGGNTYPGRIPRGPHELSERLENQGGMGPQVRPYHTGRQRYNEEVRSSYLYNQFV